MSSNPVVRSVSGVARPSMGVRRRLGILRGIPELASPAKEDLPLLGVVSDIRHLVKMNAAIDSMARVMTGRIEAALKLKENFTPEDLALSVFDFMTRNQVGFQGRVSAAALAKKEQAVKALTRLIDEGIAKTLESQQSINTLDVAAHVFRGMGQR